MQDPIFSETGLFRNMGNLMIFFFAAKRSNLFFFLPELRGWDQGDHLDLSSTASTARGEWKRGTDRHERQQKTNGKVTNWKVFQQKTHHMGLEHVILNFQGVIWEV